jgi:hypothetical protein
MKARLDRSESLLLMTRRGSPGGQPEAMAHPHRETSFPLLKKPKTIQGSNQRRVAAMAREWESHQAPPHLEDWQQSASAHSPSALLRAGLPWEMSPTP